MLPQVYKNPQPQIRLQPPSQLHATYVDVDTLNKLADYIYEQKLLNPFMEHLSRLVACPGVMQVIYDHHIPIDDAGHTLKDHSVTDEAQGRIFHNLVIKVNNNDLNYSVQEIKHGEAMTSDGTIDGTINDVVLPDMSFLDVNFKNKFLDVLTNIVTLMETQACKNLDKKKVKKIREEQEIKKNLNYQKMITMGPEDAILKSLLTDVLGRACTSLKMEVNSPWTHLLKQLETSIQFHGEVEKARLYVEKFILESIQLVIYSHIKNAYMDKMLAEILNETKPYSTGNTFYKSKPKSDNLSSPKAQKSSSLTSSIDSMWSSKSGTERSRSFSSSSTSTSTSTKSSKSSKSLVASASDSDSTTSTASNTNTTSSYGFKK